MTGHSPRHVRVRTARLRRWLRFTHRWQLPLEGLARFWTEWFTARKGRPAPRRRSVALVGMEGLERREAPVSVWSPGCSAALALDASLSEPAIDYGAFLVGTSQPDQSTASSNDETDLQLDSLFKAWEAADGKDSATPSTEAQVEAASEEWDPLATAIREQADIADDAPTASIVGPSGAALPGGNSNLAAATGGGSGAAFTPAATAMATPPELGGLMALAAPAATYPGLQASLTASPSSVAATAAPAAAAAPAAVTVPTAAPAATLVSLPSAATPAAAASSRAAPPSGAPAPASPKGYVGVDPLYVMDMNNGLTIPANTTINSFSSWSENLLAQVSGATVSSYSWNLTNAPDATSVSGSSSQDLTFTWGSFTGSARTDTIVLTTTNSDSSHATQTLTYDVAGTDSPAYSASRPTTSSTWPNVITPDMVLADQQMSGTGSAGSVGSLAGNLGTTYSMPAYNPGVAPVSLVYSSTAVGDAPVFLIHYQLNPSGSLPASETVGLTVNGGNQYTATWANTGLNPGDYLELSMDGNGGGLGSGRYSYSITVTPSSGTATTWSGSYDYVNLSGSVVGPGWTVGNVYSLVSVTGGIVLSEPGGYSLWFASAGGNNYTTPAGDFSTLVKNGDGSYTRTLPDGTKYNFNSSGFQTSVVDRIGNTTTYAYSSGKLTTITDMNGLVTTFAYNASNKVTSITDPASRVTTLSYNASNQPTSITNPDGTSWGYSYDSSGHMTKVTDPASQTTTYTLGSASRVTAAARPVGASQSYTPVAVYDYQHGGFFFGPTPTAKLLAAAQQTYTDGRGNVWQYGVDWTGFGEVVTAADPLGNTAITDRDTNGLPWMTADALGRRTRSSFDSKGNPTTVVYADDTKDLYAYNSTFAEVTQHTDPTGGLWTYNYDSVGNKTVAIDALGNRTTMTYTSKGSVSTVTDPLSHVSTYAYDSRDRLATLTDPLSNVTSYGYDSASDKTTSTDPLSHTTTMAFDSMGRMTSETHADGGVVSYAYDADGRLTKLTDPVSNVTSYAFDGDNRLTKETDPLGHTVTYSYDGADNVTSMTDRDGRQTSYTYDAANRKTLEQWINSLGTVTYTATYAYDAANEITSASDNNSAYAYTYDSLGRLKTVDNNGTPSAPRVTLTYGYNAAGDKTSITDNQSGSISYGYDADHRLTSETTPVSGGTATLTYGYDNASRQTSVTRTAPSADTITSSFGYDNDNRQTSITHTDTTSSTTLATYTYGYDNGSRLTTYTGPEGTLNYGYDAVNQLTSVSGARAETYTYDHNGNRTMSGYTTGTENELTTDGTYNYTYDNEGNLVTQTRISDGQVTTFTYDYRNRLTEEQVSTSGGTVINDQKFTYDVNNNRIGVYLNGAQQSWTTYDGSSPYLDFNGSGGFTERYVTDPSSLDQFLARVSSSGSVNWYLTDNLGSVRQIVSAGGSVLDALTYGTFGNVLTETNAANGDRFKFACGEYDSITALYRFGARYYSPSTGRWTSQDPLQYIAGDANLYRYVQNSPTIFTDPTGLDRIVHYSVHGWITVDLWDNKGNKIGQADLHFTFFEDKNKTLYQVDDFCTCWYPTWYDYRIPSTPEQDRLLLEMWKELENERQRDPSGPLRYSGGWNCWCPVIQLQRFPDVPEPRARGDLSGNSAPNGGGLYRW